VKLHCAGVLQVVGMDVLKRWFRSLSDFMGEICAQRISLEDTMFYFAALESETWFSICKLFNEAASCSGDIESNDLMTVNNELE
jgi:hypothetical protein